MMDKLEYFLFRYIYFLNLKIILKNKKINTKNQASCCYSQLLGASLYDIYLFEDCEIIIMPWPKEMLIKNAIILITMRLREIKVYVSSEVPNPNGKHHFRFSISNNVKNERGNKNILNSFSLSIFLSLFYFNFALVPCGITCRVVSGFHQTNIPSVIVHVAEYDDAKLYYENIFILHKISSS